MELLELIQSIDAHDDEEIVFAELIDGKFKASSDVAVLQLSDDELSLSTLEVAKTRCPGKSYFFRGLPNQRNGQ